MLLSGTYVLFFKQLLDFLVLLFHNVTGFSCVPAMQISIIIIIWYIFIYDCTLSLSNK